MDSREVKVVLLGDSGVGKSSIVLRFVSNHFKEHSDSTIGASFMSKTLVVGKSSIKFQIWDTAGQEKYHSLAPMYYRGSAAAIVVYDITRKESFDTLKTWVAELRTMGPPDIVIILAGNKLDLAYQRQVQFNTAEQYAREIGAFYLETSAKDDTNVVKLFENLTSRLPSAAAAPQPHLSILPIEEKKSSSCC